MAVRYEFDMVQVAAWYAAGLSVRQCAAKAGTSSRTMHRHMMAAGIEMRASGPGDHPVCRRPSPGLADRAAMAAARREGLSMSAIADRSGWSETTVRKVLRRDLGRTRRARLARAVAAEDAVRRLWGEGLRGAEIDRRLGWGPRPRAADIQRRLGLVDPVPDPVVVAGWWAELGTVKAVAARAGVGARRVRLLLAGAGVDTSRRALLKGCGSLAAYQRGCRCVECVAANTERHRAQRAGRAARREAEAPHGTTSGYTNWGCRCAACFDARPASSRGGRGELADG